MRLLLTKEGDWWTAQGIDIDVAIQTKNLGEVETLFTEAATATEEIYREMGAEMDRAPVFVIARVTPPPPLP